MIKTMANRVGEALVHRGDNLIADADLHRVKYGNPREVPERTMSDYAGERLQNLGRKLLEFSDRPN